MAGGCYLLTMKHLTHLEKSMLEDDLSTPIAILIICLGIGAVALVFALGFYFGKSVCAASFACLFFAAAGCCVFVIRRKTKRFMQDLNHSEVKE